MEMCLPPTQFNKDLPPIIAFIVHLGLVRCDTLDLKLSNIWPSKIGKNIVGTCTYLGEPNPLRNLKIKPFPLDFGA